MSINNTNWAFGVDLPKETQSCARLSPPEKAAPEWDAQELLGEIGTALSCPTAAGDKSCTSSSSSLGLGHGVLGRVFRQVKLSCESGVQAETAVQPGLCKQG